ncbi:hypothetical protein H310_07439 [Aphanomyces invadans]|uniref:Uncharacterized protein n=1 Tax=Aphanomyces invadans TaxID=157072 RepID=A0A024U0Q6_9STRA|nr:hypothetical protein H310_07439 [Aphanomyces invadans]ETV99990.1 hypothetical protein H310_07439 [Aphanomyces invadans]|eukprot:XP_008871408.1 hypothetical protein H310_07439 [Aphanomyces invadans]
MKAHAPKRTKKSRMESKDVGSIPECTSTVSLNVLDLQTVAQTYKFTDAQCRVYDAFAKLLEQFDTTIMLDILEDVLHDAQHRTRLHNYLGVNPEAQMVSSIVE